MRLFDVTTNLKHRVFLKTVYSAGLRLGEAICLRPEHIESDPSRMMIRVEQGKGKKDRYTILSRHCSRSSGLTGKNTNLENGCSPGQNRKRHMSATSAHEIFHKAKKKPASPGVGASICFAIRLPPTFCPKDPTFISSNSSWAITP